MYFGCSWRVCLSSLRERERYSGAVCNGAIINRRRIGGRRLAAADSFISLVRSLQKCRDRLIASVFWKHTPTISRLTQILRYCRSRLEYSQTRLKMYRYSVIHWKWSGMLKCNMCHWMVDCLRSEWFWCDYLVSLPLQRNKVYKLFLALSELIG